MKTKLPLTLTHAQHLAWLHQQPTPATSREALGRFQETVRQCQKAFEDDRLLSTQSLLEDSLVQLLIAMKSFDLQPDQALHRALERLQDGSGKRAFHIFSERVEIRVGAEVRGEWPLYSQNDYQSALSLAHELGCNVIHEDACQLELFSQHVHPA
jgi:hypothetical protein